MFFLYAIFWPLTPASIESVKMTPDGASHWASVTPPYPFENGGDDDGSFYRRKVGEETQEAPP